jgi:trigger factor
MCISQLLDTLAEKYTFEVPAGMADAEFDSIWRQVEEARQQAGGDDPDAGKSDDELKEEYRGIAERRVRLGLILSDVAQNNNLQISQDELNRAMIAEARRHPGHEQQVFEFFQKNPQAVDGLRAPILEDKVVDYILEIAKVEESVVTPDELLRDPEEDDGAKPKKAKSGAAKKKAAAKPAAKSKAPAKSGDKGAAKKSVKTDG